MAIRSPRTESNIIYHPPIIVIVIVIIVNNNNIRFPTCSVYLIHTFAHYHQPITVPVQGVRHVVVSVRVDEHLQVPIDRVVCIATRVVIMKMMVVMMVAVMVTVMVVVVVEMMMG